VLGSIIQDNGNLDSLEWHFSWAFGDEEANLDGPFTAEVLEAIACWMKSKTGS